MKQGFAEKVFRRSVEIGIGLSRVAAGPFRPRLKFGNRTGNRGIIKYIKLGKADERVKGLDFSLKNFYKVDFKRILFCDAGFVGN